MATTLVQFGFTEDQIARLDKLKAKTEAASYAEVLQHALRIYEYAVEVGGPDAKLVTTRADGVTEIVKLFA